MTKEDLTIDDIAERERWAQIMYMKYFQDYFDLNLKICTSPPMKANSEWRYAPCLCPCIV